jgi:DNA mismatch endonuclease (patch repair protein)
MRPARMADIVDKSTRSFMMSRIGPKDTRPEMVVRRYLHRLGFRYRLHAPELPGRPDLTFPKYRAALFVNGCFWHRHPGCRFATLPASNRVFWVRKFDATVRRDEQKTRALEHAGWRVLVIWECEVREVGKLEALAERIRGM